MRAHGMRHSNQIVHGDQTKWRDNFYKDNHVPALAKKNCDTNADTPSACDS